MHPVAPEQLAAARRSDEDAFRVLVEPYRGELQAHCYPDAIEDGFASPAARYERREAVELAFIAALQHLPGQQRAVLILREVLGFSAKETAELLDTTPASVNSSLQRARKAIDKRLPDVSQQATMRALGDSGLRALVQRFIEAMERGDVEAIVALLTDDATFSMPPYVTWYRGRDRIAESWLIPGERPERLRYLVTRASGQPAVAAYRLDPAARAHFPIVLDVITLRGQAIADVTAFRSPGIILQLGLPGRLPAR